MPDSETFFITGFPGFIADRLLERLARKQCRFILLVQPSWLDRARQEIDRRIDALAARGRDPLPRKVRFTTYTLRYNRMAWVVIDRLERHWDRARVEADLVDATTVKATTQNVTALTFTMAPGLCPLDNTRKPTVSIDGQMVSAAPVLDAHRKTMARMMRETTLILPLPLRRQRPRSPCRMDGPELPS